MKLNDYIFLANKNLSRRKGTVIVSTILIIISVVIFILAYSFIESLSSTMDKAILNNIAYRTIVVTGVPNDKTEEVVEEINKNPNITVAMKSEEYSTYVNLINLNNEFENISIGLIGVGNYTQPNIIKGRNIEDGENKVCIIPKRLYTDSIYEDYDINKYVNIEDLLGKKISIEYYSYDEGSKDTNRSINKNFIEEYTVVGVYDETENVMDSNSLFIPYSDVNCINQNIKDNTILNPNVVYSNKSTIMAIVNNSLNVEKVLEDIQQLKYRALVKSTANTNLLNIVNLITSIVLIVLVIIIFVNIVSSSIKSVNERKYEIGMMKAIGYKNNTIQNILLTENLIIGIKAYLAGLIISIFSMGILQNFIFKKYYGLDKINIKINIPISIAVMIVVVIVPLISTFFTSKNIAKKNPVILNKES